MKLTIRNEVSSEYRKVEELAREAFWNLYHPGCEEHYVVHKMRTHPDFIEELTFVIEVDGCIEGAIFYTRSKVIMGTGTPFETISFGPVFISPQYHRKGLGKHLITHSIDKAKAMGFKAILTLGYPYHYKPYGFLGGRAYGIAMEDGKYYTGLLALPLHQDALRGVSGKAVFSDVFDVSEEEVEAFDKTFPFKEKNYQKSQTEYEIACAELDE